MRYLLLAAVLFLSSHLFANKTGDYKSHIASDRLILIFDKTVSAERKAEIIESSGMVNHFAHLPSPALSICFVNDREAAQKYFSAIPEIKFVSFFITDGQHYAGVLNDFFLKLKDKNFEPMLREKLKQQNLGEAKPDKYIPNLYSVINNRSSIINTLDLCSTFASEGWVEYAVPDYLFNPLVTSNDLFYPRQWNICNTGTSIQGSGTPDADMDVDSAWTISTGDSTIKVAIIDSGVDTLHNDLKANLLPGHDAVSDSTDGYPTPAFPNDGHGTCCAGIVAAVKDNTIGIAGVSPSCKIIPVRAFYYIQLSPPPADPLPYSSAAIFADAIGWAWNNADADILSNSWGLPASLIGLLQGGTQPVDDAIQQAYLNARNGKGIAMFFSSGNEEDSSGPIWPGKLAQTIAVNATSMCDERKNATDCSSEIWSGNFGNGLDFSAPGVKITTTDMRGTKGFAAGDYTYTFNGTSAACPNAAGVGALLLSVRPDLRVEDVRRIIAETCDKVGGYAYDTTLANGSWSRELGYGRVNAFQALQYALTYSAIKESEDATLLSIFPNPSNGMIHIQMGGKKSAALKLYDIAGKVLLESQIQEGANTIDASVLSSGIYLVRLQDEAISRKLIIAR
jgi:subtilisin family serine protease